MHDPLAARIDERNRALGMVRHLRNTAIVAAAALTATLSLVAAASNPGRSTSPETGASTPQSSAGSTGTTTQPTPVPTANGGGASGFQPPSQPITGGFGSGSNTTSGGS